MTLGAVVPDRQEKTNPGSEESHLAKYELETYYLIFLITPLTTPKICNS